MDVKCRKNYK